MSSTVKSGSRKALRLQANLTEGGPEFSSNGTSTPKSAKPKETIPVVKVEREGLDSIRAYPHLSEKQLNHIGKELKPQPSQVSSRKGASLAGPSHDEESLSDSAEDSYPTKPQSLNSRIDYQAPGKRVAIVAPTCCSGAAASTTLATAPVATAIRGSRNIDKPSNAGEIPGRHTIVAPHTVPEALAPDAKSTIATIVNGHTRAAAAGGTNAVASPGACTGVINLREQQVKNLLDEMLKSDAQQVILLLLYKKHADLLIKFLGPDCKGRTGTWRVDYHRVVFAYSKSVEDFKAVGSVVHLELAKNSKPLALHAFSGAAFIVFSVGAIFAAATVGWTILAFNIQLLSISIWLIEKCAILTGHVRLAILQLAGHYESHFTIPSLHTLYSSRVLVSASDAYYSVIRVACCWLQLIIEFMLPKLVALHEYTIAIARVGN